MITVDAELWDVEDPPWIQVTVAGLPDQCRVTLAREVPGLPTAPVRGAIDLTDPAGAIIIYDVQAALGRPVIYVATVTMTEPFAGKNLFNPDDPDVMPETWMTFTGAPQANELRFLSGFIPVEAGQQYTANPQSQIAFFTAAKAFVTGSYVATTNPATVTAPAGAAYMRVSALTADLGALQVEHGATATAHEPYYNYAAGQVVEFSSVPTTLDNPSRHVLTDPLTGESVYVDLLGPAQPERKTSARGSVLPIIGRPDPVVIYDVRSTEAGALSVSTASPAERDQLTRLLAPGRPLVSRHRYDTCDHPAVEILAFNDVTHIAYAAGRRIWTMPFVTVSDPDPAIAPSGATLQDLHYYQPGTLADLALDFPTLLDIARSDLVR